MSGIAGIIHWNGEPVERSDLDRMVGLMQHRGPDGIESDTSGPVALSHAKMCLRHEERDWRPQPVWLPNRSKAVVADARLYNRDDLRERLGKVEWFRDVVSDAEIILALFERYGEDTPDLLDGDFAFVIWDAEASKVFAARDPFGAKPLVFWAQGERFVFASEPKQILALPYVPVAPDDLAVGEVLVNRYVDSGRTFYEGLRLIRPAHYLTASKAGWREARHWNPDPENVTSFSRPDECFEQFRAHLKNAVTRRLQIDHPAVTELSGGYDSSAIVVLAAAGQTEGAIPCPRIETLSAVYPGLPCDESEYSVAISEVVPFRRRTYVGSETEKCIGAEEDLRRLDAPYLHTPDGESLAIEQNLRGAGAKVLLSGIGGDELTLDRAMLKDLAESYQYRHFARLLWSFKRLRGDPTTTFVQTLVRLALPSRVRAGLRRLRPRGSWRAPSYLSLGFARRLESYFDSFDEEGPRFPSHLRQDIFDGASSPRTHRGVELGERRRSYMGVEQRYPFLDRILVEFVLGIRHSDRIPDTGAPKYLLRRALSRELPPLVKDRGGKTSFTSVRQLGVEQVCTRLLESETWLSEPYVAEETARRVMQHQSSEDGMGLLNPLAGLECWLRGLPV